MKTTTKFGAVLIGLMFLLSLVAVPVNAGVGDHKIVVGPSTGNYADHVKIYEGQTLVGDRDTVSGSAYFYLAHGDYRAEIYQSGVLKVEISFVVSDTSGSLVIYNLDAATNHAPTASFTYTATDLTVNVDASASSDPDGDSLLYSWDWGDGNGKAASSEKTATHTYASAGSYSIKLTVDDGKGGTDTKTILLTIEVASKDVTVYDLNFKDEVAPGSTQNFELELKNVATYDAEDVTATIIIKGIAADKEDLETEIDFGTIDAGDKQSETVSITIPQDADDKTYTVSVDLAWKDADGNKYTGTYTSPDKIEVVKQKHQISITNVQLDAAKYKTGDTVQLAVSLLDTGANDETVALKATSDIGISATSASFKLNEGDATTQYLSFVVPDNAKAGKYFVVVSAVYGSLSAAKSVVLEVASNEAPTTVTVVEPKTESGTDIPASEIALAVIIILLIGAIGWMAKDFILPQKARPIVVRAKR